MTHASLFSGIGGPEVAAALLGWENLFHCEINPFGRKVLEYWFPDSVSYEDITKTSFKEWSGKVDVLTGGFPCQPFSYAGKRGGAEDARYLWPEMLRAIDEIRPAWVVGENVAGLSTMVEGWLPTEVGRGAALFEEGADLHDWVVEQTFTVERIAGELEGLGYSVQPVLVPAAACGAPHRRDRIFILAHRDGDNLNGERRAAEREIQKECDAQPGGACDGIQQGGGAAIRLGAAITSDAGPQKKRKRENSVCGAGAAPDPASRGGGALSEHIQARLPDGDLSLCYGRKRDASDTHGAGREESVKPGRGENRQKNEAGLDDRAERPRRGGDATNPEGINRGAVRGYDEPTQGEPWAGKSRRGSRKDRAGLLSSTDLLPGNRWREFPTVSPVHRGNDGLPFNVDGLTISFTSWRTESLKAYGNAIVPQVMYRIFEAIEKVSK